MIVAGQRWTLSAQQLVHLEGGTCVVDRPRMDSEVNKRLSLPLLVLVGWLVLEAPVDAYLDSGSGSMLLQILLGGFAAVGVIARLYWHRVASFFRRLGLPGD